MRKLIRQTAAGPVGGVPYTGGPLAYLLKNRIYLGEILHKGQPYPGEHEPILETAVFNAVQAQLAENGHADRAAQQASDALLKGKIFDSAGHTMSPTYVRKAGLRYRYYISRALVEGRKAEAGSVPRVPAHEIESRVIEALRATDPICVPGIDDRGILVRAKRVKIASGHILVELAQGFTREGQFEIKIPWSPKPNKVRRNIILPHLDATKDPRPIRAERRETLLRSIAKGRAWLKELMAGEVTDPDAIAAREDCSSRSVHMTISLAFVAPDIVEAAVKGALARGIGKTRLMDLPPLWSDQRRLLGLQA